MGGIGGEGEERLATVGLALRAVSAGGIRPQDTRAADAIASDAPAAGASRGDARRAGGATADAVIGAAPIAGDQAAEEAQADAARADPPAADAVAPTVQAADRLAGWAGLRAARPAGPAAAPAGREGLARLRNAAAPALRGAAAALGAIGNALLPPLCPGCGAETGAVGTLCPGCWAETRFLAGGGCERCGRPVPGIASAEPGFACDDCLAHPPVWDRGRAALAYAGTGRRLVLALKHGDRLDVVPMLAGWMLRAARPLVDRADLIAPVPLHWTRRLKRRFNQSGELARALAERAGRRGALAPDLVRRLRRTPSQEGRDRAGRAENVAGAFALAPGGGTRVAGRRVLLVDDVMTTGATLNAVAAVLRDAGAAGVDMVVLALVDRSFDRYISADESTPAVHATPAAEAPR